MTQTFLFPEPGTFIDVIAVYNTYWTGNRGSGPLYDRRRLYDQTMFHAWRDSFHSGNFTRRKEVSIG